MGCIVPMSERISGWVEDPRISWTGISPFGCLKGAAKAGRLSILHHTYGAFPRLLVSGTVPADVALVQVAPSDNGTWNLGVSVDYTAALLSTATLRVAQVNSRMPRTHGETQVDPALFDCVVEADRALPQLRLSKQASGVEEAIAANVRRLVRDGDCVEIGWGSLGDAVWHALAGKKDLGVHSGFLSDSVTDAMDAGVVTNRFKQVETGRTVGTVALGSDKLYRAVDDNPKFSMMPSTFTHATNVIEQIDRFTAINFALEVDLSGQANSEMTEGRYVGALGGLPDFANGAGLSHGGRSVIALRSRAAQMPGIVARLSNGNVSLPRSLVDFVVTEYGVAEITMMSLNERRSALVALAHPEDRARLMDYY